MKQSHKTLLLWVHVSSSCSSLIYQLVAEGDQATQTQVQFSDFVTAVRVPAHVDKVRDSGRASNTAEYVYLLQQVHGLQPGDKQETVGIVGEDDAGKELIDHERQAFAVRDQARGPERTLAAACSSRGCR